MAEDIHQREAGQVCAVGAPQHDRVSTQIGSQSQGLTAFGVRRVGQSDGQVIDNQTDGLDRDALHLGIFGFANSRIQYLQGVGDPVQGPSAVNAGGAPKVTS